jgi:preprotein translocase subunit YajC
MNLNDLTLLAQDSGPQNPPTGGGAAPTGKPVATTDTTSGSPPISGDGETTSGGGLGGMLPFLIIMVLFMWFMVFLPQRRERKRHAQMMGGMGKGDKVVTNGGIIGTVVEVRDGEVVIKVDESNNTKMRFLPDAIRGVVDKKDGSGGSESKDEKKADPVDEKVGEK